MKRLKWAALPALLGLLAALPVGATAASTASGKLVIDNESGATWTCQFNPFNPAVTLTSFGTVYEPLEFENILAKSSKSQVTPWLATGSKWSSNYKTLSFTIRKGVKWSDGTPFSASDVAYTFNAMKADKAIDVNALWSNDGGPLTSVAVKGSNVVFTFKAAAQPYFYYVADQTPIVPAHVWSKLSQSKLQSYTDTQPVGTGPYKIGACSPQNIQYLNNTSYWQSKPGHPVPAVKEVDYPAFLSNTSANLALSQGQAQWGGQYIPNIQSFYVSKNAGNHYWFPPVLNVSLFPNLTNPLLKQKAVREAISYGINRTKVAKLGESGYQRAANQSGVITPTFESWQDKSLPAITYNPAKAVKILKAAGFVKGSNGIFKSKSGQPLSFTIKTISGFSDWDSSLQLITAQLKQIGISVTVQDENSGPYTSDLSSGHYDLAYAGSGGPGPSAGPSPYYELRGYLFGGNIGSTNYERYKSPATDALFDQYSSDSPAKQLQVIHKIEKVMVSDVPFIPVTEGVNWFQYNTAAFSGWPSATDQYALPAPYATPDMGVVLTHLKPLS
jgi:peptide/nickel transport system substrate-binding protein